MTPEAVARAADELMQGLLDIPASELVQCARENLKATYRVRLSKEDCEGKEVPDFGIRQKALEWIAAQRAGTAPARKPIDPPKHDADDKAPPGVLRDGKARKAGAGSQ